ncbi:MAG: hypothetical protein JNM63_07260, partial [Spirochaetia bacterium]|nr:hypothetical protein [Spirochaetia bacterium]
TPNPFELNAALANPDKVIAYYDGSVVRLEITGLNTSQLSPDFSGYNVYFDRVNTLTTILNRVLFINNPELPTVNAFISDQLTTTPASFDKLYYSNIATGEIRQESFLVHEGYFLIVRSYSRKGRANSDSQNVTEVHIPKILKNQTTAENTVVSSADNVTFRFVNNTLQADPGVTLQSMGYQSDWFNIKRAPTNGFVATPLPLSVGSLYYLNYQTNYAKVWLLSYDGVNANYHLSFLQKSPLL